jgi:hypothetical protein
LRNFTISGYNSDIFSSLHIFHESKLCNKSRTSERADFFSLYGVCAVILIMFRHEYKKRSILYEVHLQLFTARRVVVTLLRLPLSCYSYCHDCPFLMTHRYVQNSCWWWFSLLRSSLLNRDVFGIWEGKREIVWARVRVRQLTIRMVFAKLSYFG